MNKYKTILHIIIVKKTKTNQKKQIQKQVKKQIKQQIKQQL